MLYSAEKRSLYLGGSIPFDLGDVDPVPWLHLQERRENESRFQHGSGMNLYNLER